MYKPYTYLQSSNNSQNRVNYLTKTGPRSTLGSLAATAAVLASNVTAVRMNFILSSFVVDDREELIVVMCQVVQTINYELLCNDGR